jgi:hypothetical protein
MFGRFGEYVKRKYVKLKRGYDVREFSTYSGLSTGSAHIMVYMDSKTKGRKDRLGGFEEDVSIIENFLLESSKLVGLTNKGFLSRKRRLHKDRKFREKVFDVYERIVIKGVRGS